MKPRKLWRTTAVIWTDYDPQGVELVDLAREATDGDGFCSSQTVKTITDRKQFPRTEFFDTDGGK